MADLVVKDLDGLVSDLNELISQFEDALDLQNDEKGQWGQNNANLSMGDFADNWTVHRNKMVDAMKKFRDKVKELDEAWTEAEKQLTDSMEQK
ncbi:hypothetical protein Acy02nite_71590 [Actinoplanes cyaneus]|uniref:Uncharacterized protein n=1 Tax=Actinoplanes cyaneus TaxID=52696 RepID=A0A919M9B5_9ACTN|nr:hypothetical protein [Actinoplanes cyaneus]MCW2142260.1 hypothetical protein [Actinoplanes cyaneus]GID69278.1 hypothetical protein Acy02nite_71590 [Actinoplanes cyaneus]